MWLVAVTFYLVVFDSETPWTVVHQGPLSTGFFRQEYWSGLPFPTPGDWTCISCVSCTAGGFFAAEPLGRSPDGLMTATFSRMSNWGSKRLSKFPKSRSKWLQCLPLILQDQKEEESEPAPLGTVSQGYQGKECILASLKKSFRDFLGGPAAGNVACNAGGTGSIPGWGTGIPHGRGDPSPRASTGENPMHHDECQCAEAGTRCS